MHQFLHNINSIPDDVKKFAYLNDSLPDLTLDNVLDVLSMIDVYLEDSDEEKDLMKRVIKDHILDRFDER